jgi:hypothetical protein
VSPDSVASAPEILFPLNTVEGTAALCLGLGAVP